MVRCTEVALVDGCMNNNEQRPMIPEVSTSFFIYRVKFVLNLEVVDGVRIKPQTLDPGNQHPKLAHPSLKTFRPGFSPGLLMWQWSTLGS
jgi:hypothetical protein